VLVALAHSQQIKSFKKSMSNETEATIMVFIMVVILLFDSIKLLFSILEKGIMKDRRELLMVKTKAELKSMLGEVKGISRHTKPQLVELLLA